MARHEEITQTGRIRFVRSVFGRLTLEVEAIGCHVTDHGYGPVPGPKHKFWRRATVREALRIKTLINDGVYRGLHSGARERSDIQDA